MKRLTVKKESVTEPKAKGGKVECLTKHVTFGGGKKVTKKSAKAY